MNSTTSIDDILNIFEDENDENLNDENLNDENLNDDPLKRLFCFSLTTEKRMEAFEICYEQDPNEIIEIVNKLLGSYRFTYIKLLEKFITELVLSSSLLDIIKVECVEILFMNERSRENAFRCLYSLFENDNLKTVDISIKVSFIFQLYSNEIYKEYAQKQLCSVIQNQDYSNEFRYRIIKSIETKINLLVFKSMLFVFTNNILNDIKYILLGLQTLLAKCSLNEQENKETIFHLVFIANDERYSDNIRADSADILIHYGSPDDVRVATKILKELGGDDGMIYSNKQNVHLDNIVQAVIDIVFRVKKECKNLQIIPFEDACLEIKTTSNKKEIEFALTRIDIDNTVFKSVNMTIKDVFELIYTFISSHSSKEELLKRLNEELFEMSDTCASGYLDRLANVLSGFDDFSIGITFDQQIEANLFGRFNCLIQEDENADLLIEEMTLSNVYDRKLFLGFFLKNIGVIQSEMKKEFKDFVSEDEFDVYFSKAMNKYTN